VSAAPLDSIAAILDFSDLFHCAAIEPEWFAALSCTMRVFWDEAADRVEMDDRRA